VAGHARSRADAPTSEVAVGRLHEATGRPVLTAAAAGQFAHEGLIGETGERHGVFTWAVLDALRKGDSNGNSLIELSELVGHVQSVVPKVAAGLVRAAAREPVLGKQTASGRAAKVSPLHSGSSSQRERGCESQERVKFARGAAASPRRNYIHKQRVEERSWHGSGLHQLCSVNSSVHDRGKGARGRR
jgi:hypothetical protein